jgi:hypothetical protein
MVSRREEPFLGEVAARCAVGALRWQLADYTSPARKLVLIIMRPPAANSRPGGRAETSRHGFRRTQPVAHLTAEPALRRV